MGRCTQVEARGTIRASRKYMPSVLLQFFFLQEIKLIIEQSFSFILLQLQAIGSGASPVNNPRQAAFEGRVQAMNYSTGVNSSNKRSC